MYFSVAKSFFQILSFANVALKVVLATATSTENPFAWIDIVVGVVAAIGVLYTARRFVQALVHVTFVSTAWVACLLVLSEFTKREDVQSVVQTSKIALQTLLLTIEEAYKNVTATEARP